MDTRPIRTLEDPSLASPAELEDALAHWDELDASSLARLDADPRHGPRLRALRAAESWLSGSAPAAPDLAGPCPSAEALYEYGRGPGARGSERDPALVAHLEHCVVCAGLVASLEVAPPLPLEWTRLEDEELQGAEDPVLPRQSEAPNRVSPWFARYFPLAAAAALLVGVFIVPRLRPDSELAGLPNRPLLRGTEDTALYYPRGPVLADARGSAAPLFELAPVAGASEYRVELFLHDGGAFAEGRLVADLRSNAAVFLPTPLSAGGYTWRAYATVDGLERKLGELDFEIRALPELRRDTPPGEVAEIVERIAQLHAAGFLTDARALAQRLPDGPEKEAYLLPPGR